MSSLSVYPPGLPAPQSLDLTVAERRATQGLQAAAPTGAPASARALQRDLSASGSASFVLAPRQVAAWQVWWEMAASYGAAWFAVTWPFPWGVGGVVRFAGVPQWRHLGAGIQRLEIGVEVRGRGAAPVVADPPLPMTITDVTAGDITTYGGELAAQMGAVVALNDEWQVPSFGYLAPGALRAYRGRRLPTRGSLLSGPVQMRGTADTTGALGRLGFTVGVASFTDAGLLFAAGGATRHSRVTGADDRGYVSLIVWPEPITAFHAAVLGLPSYSVNNSGPVLAASNQMLRLTWGLNEEVRALLVIEHPPTNFAGAAGTGSARQLTVHGLQIPN
jgi:hypothetical protein